MADLADSACLALSVKSCETSVDFYGRGIVRAGHSEQGGLLDVSNTERPLAGLTFES